MELHVRTGTNSRGIIDKQVTLAGTQSRPRDLLETRDKELSGFPRAQTRQADSIMITRHSGHRIGQQVLPLILMKAESRRPTVLRLRGLPWERRRGLLNR